eukprot:6212287-Pleurochrysis_carterae.AAC.3
MDYLALLTKYIAYTSESPVSTRQISPSQRDSAVFEACMRSTLQHIRVRTCTFARVRFHIHAREPSHAHMSSVRILHVTRQASSARCSPGTCSLAASRPTGNVVGNCELRQYLRSSRSCYF